MIRPAVTPVVLAAGAGRRLGSSIPKPLVDIGGEPLLASLLAQVHATVGSSIVAVTEGSGVASAIETWPSPPGVVVSVPGPPVSDLITLAATIEHWQGDLVLIDGDLVVAPSLLALLGKHRGSAVIIDPFRTQTQIDMRVAGNDGALRALGKTLACDDTVAEFTGMARIAFRDLRSFAELVTTLSDAPEADGSYEDALTGLAAVTEVRLVATPRSGMWLDVDTPADLETARRTAARVRAG